MTSKNNKIYERLCSDCDKILNLINNIYNNKIDWEKNPIKLFLKSSWLNSSKIAMFNLFWKCIFNRFEITLLLIPCVRCQGGKKNIMPY